MLRQLFSAKPAKCSYKLHFQILLLFILGHTLAMGQGVIRSKADTVSLSRFEFAQKMTNNGSDCICSITNTSQANIAMTVLTGAPDAIQLDSTAIFNGTHSLKPGQQVIAVGNFAGKQITVLNLSLMDVVILVMLFCPG
ncbi:hypothetical protein HHL23_02650 [Chryseobacterium sp. RP-3-3]|uniref:Uncharacterized protein n=1 Tax=Chryseobacterium antibioticum TaxID=2728847 RepID=A0A7Y0FQI9_9FLAO|nr:hypothetical protein [Chryseobacterium antibioticum]NML68700.1 hypothetical protein [Chryseobacterium antibioticum]